MMRIAPSMKKAQAISALMNGQGSAQNGAELLSELVRLSTEQVIQQLLEHEQAEFLGRQRYERGSGKGHRNGYEDARLRTAEGVLNVRVPQVRGLDTTYQSPLWSRLATKSEVLQQIVTEMYVRGLSVRDIEETLAEASGSFVISDTAVSQTTQHLHDQYEAFRKRDLSGFDVAYLFVDAVYESLRRYGSRLGVLCAWGICTDGSRVLLGLQTGTSESQETCLDFLRDLTSRGLRTPMTITTDGAPGLIAAVERVFPMSLRIRCWFHKMQNLQAKVPKEAWQEFKDMVCEARDATSKPEAMSKISAVLEQYRGEFPEACRCLEDDLEASLNHHGVMPKHRILVRTTNLAERAFEEDRRRTKIIPNFVDEKSAVKLVFSVLIRVSQRWQRRHFSDFEQRQLIRMRAELLREEEPKAAQQPRAKRRSAGHVAA